MCEVRPDITWISRQSTTRQTHSRLCLDALLIPCRAVAWTVYGITVTQLGDLTNVVMTLDAGGTVRAQTLA